MAPGTFANRRIRLQIGFYALLSATMMAAGFDALTGAMMVLLGAGVGCLGSTVNPFATAAGNQYEPLSRKQKVVLWLFGLSFLVMIVGLSRGVAILIPGTSSMATISMPIMGPMTQSLGFNPAMWHADEPRKGRHLNREPFSPASCAAAEKGSRLRWCKWSATVSAVPVAALRTARR